MKKSPAKDKRKKRLVEAAKEQKLAKAAHAKKKKRAEVAIARELLNHSEGWKPGPVVKRTPHSKNESLLNQESQQDFIKRALEWKRK